MLLQLGLIMGLSSLCLAQVDPDYARYYYKWHEDEPHHTERACSYYGYIPGGEEVNIDPIPPVEVEAGTDTLDDSLGIVSSVFNAGNGIMTIAGGMVKQGSKAATACPVAAGVFGLVGLFTGI